jgi:biotin carboxyl carrier protein
MPRRRSLARLNGQALQVEVLSDGRVLVETAAAPFTVHRLRDGEYAVDDGERQWRVWVAGPSDNPTLHVAGLVAEVEFAVEGAKKRSRPSGAADALTAPMPATVVEILVEAGQAVHQGDVLVKLEAMKMELPLRAPHDGRVKTVRCSPGELVQPGATLVEME